MGGQGMLVCVCASGAGAVAAKGVYDHNMAGNWGRRWPDDAVASGRVIRPTWLSQHR